MGYLLPTSLNFAIIAISCNLFKNLLAVVAAFLTFFVTLSLLSNLLRLKSALLFCTHVIIPVYCSKFSISLSQERNKPAPVLLDFRKADYGVIIYVKNSFGLIRPRMISSHDNVQLLYDSLLHQLHLIINCYVPTKSPKAKSKTPCHIRKLLLKKKGLYPSRSISPEVKLIYKRACKSYDEAVAQWYYKIEGLVCNNPSSKFCGYANCKLKVNLGIPHLKTDSTHIYN